MRENSIAFYQKFQNIKFDISKASLEDVTDILNHYNCGPITFQGVSYNYTINPLYAACLNERYKELSGEDHPIFLREQLKVLDKEINEGPPTFATGGLSIYQRLRNNLTGEGPGISIINDSTNNYISKFNKIKYDMSKASLEDVNEILNYYDQDSVLISGTETHFRPTVFEGASLNARFKELTGKDHPVFAQVQEKRLDEIIDSESPLSVNGRPSIYQQLKDKTLEIGTKNHVLNRASNIIFYLDQASLDDISALLEYFNGNSVLIDGIVHHPFNDPVTADKLNKKYHELTGKNHPQFEKEAPKVIDSLLEQEQTLSHAFPKGYFERIAKIKETLNVKETPQIENDGPEFE